ncbi:MAG: nicotinate phosphoribosyltransferase [Thermoplasmata archaeon YP2-bin.285]|uniref:nicotinate phosphoribosyltransferase n=1 Tax=Candidatus Sysuiplasma superficiale TaxID=2823368 RepID=A0A8J8CFZ6_9ARCH|nr:nicotinate phosphoribosyltransferase [Candidatus Sysuiplasma superficiale]
MKSFFTATDDEIREGRTTDVYFTRTRKILEKNGLKTLRVSAEITSSEFPSAWRWGVFTGVEEAIRLLEGRPVDVYAAREGTVFRTKSRNGVLVPMMYIEGAYYDFALYETPLLGFLCHSSGISTVSARYRRRCRDRSLLAFGIRRAHPAIAPMVDRASFIGGCDSVSSIAGAKAIGVEPQGTMPHASVLVFGDSGKAFRAYSEAVPEGERKIALADTFSDERCEVMLAAHTIGDLYGVRLDTPRSRRGSLPSIVSEIRWELNLNGKRDVRIFVSGGIREEDIDDLIAAGADGFGVGTAISNAPVIDYSMDIVEVEGRAISKRGKFPGRKETYRCPTCLEFDVEPRGAPVPVCPVCGSREEALLRKVISGGKRVTAEESPAEIREYVLDQLPRLEG